MNFQSEDQFRFSGNQESSHLKIILHQEKPLLESPFHKTPQKSSPKDDEDHYEQVEEQREGRERGSRKRRIEKEEKGKKGERSKKYYKRKKDDKITVSMGRPDNNGVQGEHLKENKSYNDIVYHFSRFLIFLKFLQETDKTTAQMETTAEQRELISRAQQVMGQDNFPTYEDVKPTFLLHPNSPHYVLLHYKQHSNKITYASQQIKCILIAYLKKKGLLTTYIYRYLFDYWQDIMYLVNHPKGVEGEEIPEDESEIQGEVQEMLNNENKDMNKRSESEGKKETISQYNILKDQLAKDPTIAAYQIACYLHACSQKYSITINQ